MTTLSQVAGVAAVILAIEVFVIELAVLVVVCFLVRTVGRLVPKVHLWLHTGLGWLLRAEQVVVTLMHWLLAPILFLSGLRAGVEASARALRRR